MFYLQSQQLLFDGIDMSASGSEVVDAEEDGPQLIDVGRRRGEDGGAKSKDTKASFTDAL